MLKMERICWKCKKATEVVCLASDQSYSIESGYEANPNIQLFSYLEDMPEILASYAKEQFSYFPSYSKTINKTYYVNHCDHCQSIQGDNFLHEVPEQSFYKKLCYKNSSPTAYSKINNQFSVLLQAKLPYYNEVSRSSDLIMAHLETGVENRASLLITQKLMNDLFKAINSHPNIDIYGL